ncbi:MAG: AAA family ATPase [Clostridiales bacterium]|jgi:adenylate kinase family enzyme|nr:AAA family ATPase [Clostridiales bacterium]
MNIAENILKHNLKNVYFLNGTALAGKTTMAVELSKKYGFYHFNDNWHEDRFNIYRSICNEKYQPQSTKKRETTDWEAYFGRSVEEFLADNGRYGEYYKYIEFMLIDLIKLSQDKKVVADVGIALKLLTEISEYERIACLLASPELVTCANYGKREDHKEFLECILSLKEPEKKIAVQDELFRINVEKVYEDVRQYNLFNIVRTDKSTIEDSLTLLEKHFGLI